MATEFVTIKHAINIKDLLRKRRINTHRLVVQSNFLKQRQNIPKLFIVVDVATATKTKLKEKSTAAMSLTSSSFSRPLNLLAESQNREVFIFYSTKLQMSYFLEVLKLHQSELNAIHNVIYGDICQKRFFYPLMKRLVDVATTMSMVSEPDSSSNKLGPIDKLVRKMVVPIYLPSAFKVDSKKDVGHNEFGTEILLDSIPPYSSENASITTPVYYKLERLWQRIIADSVFPLLKIYARLETISKKLFILRTILCTRHFVGTRLHMNALEQSRSLLGVLYKILMDFHDHVIKLYIHMSRSNPIYRFVNIEQIILSESTMVQLNKILDGSSGQNSNEYFNYLASILFCIQLHPEWSVKGTLVNSILQILQYDTYIRSKSFPNEEPVPFENFQLETILGAKQNVGETTNKTKEDLYKYISQTTLNSPLSISIFNSITDFEVWITDFSKKLHMSDFDHVEFQQDLATRNYGKEYKTNPGEDEETQTTATDPIEQGKKTGNIRLFPEYHIFEPRPREDYRNPNNSAGETITSSKKTELENSPGYFKLLQFQDKLLNLRRPIMTNIVMVKLFPAPDVVANSNLIDQIYKQNKTNFGDLGRELGIENGLEPEVILTPVADIKNLTKYYGKNSYSREGSTFRGFISKYVPKRTFHSVYERKTNYLTGGGSDSSILRYMYPRSVVRHFRSTDGVSDRVSSTEKRGGILSSLKYFVKEKKANLEAAYDKYLSKGHNGTTLKILSEISNYNYYSKILPVVKTGTDGNPVISKNIVAGETYNADIWLAYLVPVPDKATFIAENYAIKDRDAVQFEVEKLLGASTVGRVFTDQFERDVEYFKKRLGTLIDYIPWSLCLATVDFVRFNVNNKQLVALSTYYVLTGSLTALSLGSIVGSTFMIAFAVRYFTNNRKGINSIWWLTLLIRVSSNLMLHVACMQSIRIGCDYAITNVLSLYGIPTLQQNTIRALLNWHIRDFSIGVYQDWLRYRIALSLARSFIFVTVKLIKYALVKILSIFNPVEYILNIMFPGPSNSRKRNTIMRVFGDVLQYIYDILIDMSERALSILIGGIMNAGLSWWSEMFPERSVSEEEKRIQDETSPESGEKSGRKQRQPPNTSPSSSSPTHTADSGFTRDLITPRTTGCVGYTSAVDLTLNEATRQQLFKSCVTNPSEYYESMLNEISPNTEFFIKLHDSPAGDISGYYSFDKYSFKNLRDRNIINKRMDNFDIVWRYKSNPTSDQHNPADHTGTGTPASAEDYSRADVCVPTIACLLNTTLCGGQNITGVNGKEAIKNFTKNIPPTGKGANEEYKENAAVKFPENTKYAGMLKTGLKVAGWTTVGAGTVAAVTAAAPVLVPYIAWVVGTNAILLVPSVLGSPTAAYATYAALQAACYATIAVAPAAVVESGIAGAMINMGSDVISGIGNNNPIPFIMSFVDSPPLPPIKTPTGARVYNPINNTSPDLNHYCAINGTFELSEKIHDRTKKGQKTSSSSTSTSTSSSTTNTGFWAWFFLNSETASGYFTNSHVFDPQYVTAYSRSGETGPKIKQGWF